MYEVMVVADTLLCGVVRLRITTSDFKDISPLSNVKLLRSDQHLDNSTLNFTSLIVFLCDVTHIQCM